VKIENLRSEHENSKVRVVATISWEDCGRPTRELYFETDEKFGDGLSCNPHAFLIACTSAAMHFGEERVFIDAEICPELRDGLMTAMSWIRHWLAQSGLERKLVQIDARTQQHVLYPNKPPRAGLFFSGGIDSLATLRANRLNYPSEHPGSIKDGLVIYGLEVYEPEAFKHVVSLLSEIAQNAGINLIPVHTNIRCLGPEDDREFWNNFWMNEFMGAALAAVAHAFAPRFSVVSISSARNAANQMPHGSHPLIDPNYSSSTLRIRHEGITLSRFERTKLIADWDFALQRLRVCNKMEHYKSGMLNCGKCEKCVRTMLAFLALGMLDQTHAFPINDITEELAKKTVLLNPETLPFYKELIIPLLKKGRSDLARVVERRLTSYHEPEWKKKIRRWTLKPIAKIDKQYLRSSLSKLKQSVYKKKDRTSYFNSKRIK
jgi:hypothetical protein